MQLVSIMKMPVCKKLVKDGAVTLKQLSDCFNVSKHVTGMLVKFIRFPLSSCLFYFVVVLLLLLLLFFR